MVSGKEVSVSGGGVVTEGVVSGGGVSVTDVSGVPTLIGVLVSVLPDVSDLLTGGGVPCGVESEEVSVGLVSGGTEVRADDDDWVDCIIEEVGSVSLHPLSKIAIITDVAVISESILFLLFFNTATSFA